MSAAGPAIERVRRKLASVNDGNRQMVDILTAPLTDRLPAVEAVNTVDRFPLPVAVGGPVA